MRKSIQFVLSTFIVLIFVSQAVAQGVKKPRFESGIDLARAEAMERWNSFTASSIDGSHCMGFKILHRPRRGEETVFTGTMAVMRKGADLWTRLTLQSADNPSENADFILKNSPVSPAVWKFEGGKFVALPRADWQKPVCKGLLYSPFDLLMPFKYWTPEYVGAGRVGGRAAHFFELSSPDFPDKKVRAALTRDFNVLTRVEVVDSAGGASRLADVVSVKKVDGLWIIREASVKDMSSGDKDVLRFTKAKMRAALDADTFSPSSSGKTTLPLMDAL